MGIEEMLQNEAWYLSLWLLLAQLLLIAWAFRPKAIFKGTDPRGYWLGRYSWPKRWAAAAVGFLVVASAWLGFFFDVLGAGYGSTLVFLSSTEIRVRYLPEICYLCMAFICGSYRRCHTY